MTITVETFVFLCDTSLDMPMYGILIILYNLHLPIGESLIC